MHSGGREVITEFRRALLNALPAPVSKILRCIGAPNHFLKFSDPTYNSDGLISRHNADFLSDPLFVESYAFARTTGMTANDHPAWRHHVVYWAAHHASLLDGDFVECGVNRGSMSRGLINYVRFDRLPKTLWLLDTYHGLVETHITDEERRHGRLSGGYEECLEAVRKTFAPFRNVRIIPGTVPETLPQVTAEKIAYLAIDMNCVIPEIAAAEYFWDKLVSGALVVLDDYGWQGHEPQKQGFDDFAQHRGCRVLSLPTGQGLIIKP